MVSQINESEERLLEGNCFDRNIRFDSTALPPMHAPRRRKHCANCDITSVPLSVGWATVVGLHVPPPASPPSDMTSITVTVEIYRKIESARLETLRESNHGDLRLRPPLLLPLPRGITTHRTRVLALSWGPLPPHATHLMRFFDRMRGALTAAPTRLLPVNHIPHAAPTTLSPKPKAMPKLA